MEITIDPRRFIRVLFYVVGFLLLMHLITLYFILARGDRFFYGFVPLFNLGQEKNAPTFFSSLILVFCALLLGIIAAGYGRRSQSFYHWAVLAVVFVFLGLDELAALHEQTTDPLRETLNTGGMLYFAWIIPYAILLVVLGVFYFRFIMRLPPTTQRLFVIAGGLYVLGAMGIEAIGGMIFNQIEVEGSLSYHVASTLEEMLEMTGGLVFVYALLTYIQEHMPKLHLKMAARPVQVESPQPAIQTRQPTETRN